MLNPSDSHRFRKTVAGLCMIGAPALFLAASIIGPGLDSDEAAMATLIADNRDAWGTSSLLAMAGWGLFLIATLGVMHMLRERSVAAGHIGGGLALIGTLSAVANSAYAVVLWQLTDTGAMTTLMTNVNDSVAATLVLSLLGLGVTIGFIVLAWAMYRSHIAPALVAAAIGLSAIAFAVATLAFSQALFIVASAIGFAGFAMLGRMVLTESVEDWEHQPEFRGFTPAAGAR